MVCLKMCYATKLPFYGRENDDEPLDFGKTPLLDKTLPVISQLKPHLWNNHIEIAIFHAIYNLVGMIQSDELIFFRGVGIPPTSQLFVSLET